MPAPTIPVHAFHDPGTSEVFGVDHGWYDRLRDAAGRTSVARLEVPIRDGRAWPVRAGQVCRITTIDGPQAGDLNAWSLEDPREHFWAARTRMLEGSHVTTYSRLWSTRPFHRPMLTLIHDTLPTAPSINGARCHDLLGTGCDPFIWKLKNGVDFDRTCYNNLARSIVPYHLTELDVHDVVNLFMSTGLEPATGRYFMEPVPAKAGDYVELFAEIDVLLALSSCPAGDISIQHLGSERGDPTATCRPLGVEVFDVDPSFLAGWAPPSKVAVQPVYGRMEPLSR